MDWSLLGCGAGGHVTFAPDEHVLRERFGHPTREGLPYEIYDLTHKVTVLRVVAFLINLGLVLYLLLTKRLFGVRGGKQAYEARLRSESILDAEIAARAARGSCARRRAGRRHGTGCGRRASLRPSGGRRGAAARPRPSGGRRGAGGSPRRPPGPRAQ